MVKVVMSGFRDNPGWTLEFELEEWKIDIRRPSRRRPHLRGCPSGCDRFHGRRPSPHVRITLRGNTPKGKAVTVNAP